MTERKQTLFTAVATLTCVSLIVGFLSIWLLYRAAFVETRDWMQMIVLGQARLIETVAQCDGPHRSGAFPEVSCDERINQLMLNNRWQEGFGRTGEFLLGRQDGDRITFLMKPRFQIEHGGDIADDYTRFGSQLDEPMRLALSDRTGWTIGRDYRGKEVLAAYAPAKSMNMGLVAKKDLEELRAPYFRAAAVAGGVVLSMIVLGCIVTIRISAPILRRAADSEAQLRAVVETAVDGIISIDGQGHICSFSRGAERMFGYARDETLGRNVNMLMPSPSRDEHDSYLRNCVWESAGPVLMRGRDVLGRHKDGSEFPVEITISMTMIGGERMFIGVLRDVTERRRAEHEIKLANEELRAVNEELNQFVYTASHDLKSPLVTILGFAGHLKSEASRGDVNRLQDYADRVEAAARRMRTNIDDLLELSRIGRVMNDPVPVDVASVVNDVLQEHAAQLEELDVEVIVQSDIPHAMGDRARVVQVFDNLMTNAIRYGCKCDQPRIEIGSDLVEDEARFFVRDNGEGIAPQHHETIFGLFQKLTDRNGSTGVGLAIVRRIAEVHGGRAWVESTPGEGAAFWVALPACDCPFGPQPCKESLAEIC